MDQLDIELQNLVDTLLVENDQGEWTTGGVESSASADASTAPPPHGRRPDPKLFQVPVEQGDDLGAEVAWLKSREMASVLRWNTRGGMAEVAFDLAASLACPVCLELPAGEVHQCFEGHCYCVDCYRRLQPRHCPECREPISRKNRSRDREARVAALPAVCDDCGLITTRGAMAEHLRTCGWVGYLQPVAVMQPLAGRVRALDGEEEEGGRQRRQRAGPASHDAPPSDAIMVVMGMAEATAALREHLAVTRVAEAACRRLGTLTKGVAKFSEPLQREGVKAVVDAMRAHPQASKVQVAGCSALGHLTRALSTAGRQSAAEAGAIGAALNAMRAHLEDSTVQVLGFAALTSLCYGYDAAVLRAAEAGALQVAVAAMRSHPQDCGVQLAGAVTLRDYCQGDANKRQATEVGGRAVAFAAMQEFPGDSLIQKCVQHLLDVLPPPK